MSNSTSSAARPIAHVAIPHRDWILSALELSPSPEADQVVMGLRAIALIGLAAGPVSYTVLK